MSVPEHKSQCEKTAPGTTRAASHISTEELNLQLLEQHIRPYALRDQHEDVIRLLQHAPPAEIAKSSSLGYWFALALLSVSRMSEGSRVLHLLEQLHPTPSDLTIGRLFVLKAVESIFNGASDEALEFVQKATAILPDSALQERFRAWATIEVLSIHFGYFSLGELASERLQELRGKLPTDQHWWYTFVVPTRADWLLKSGHMDDAEAFLQDQLHTSPIVTKAVIHVRLAIIALEKRDLGRAETHIGALPTPFPYSYWYLEAELTRIEYLRAKGDTESAITALYSIIRNRSLLGSDVEIYRPQLVLAEIWIGQGQLDLATIWLDLASKSIDDWPRTYGHPIPEMTRIRLAMASDSWDDAESRLLHLCETGRLRNHNGLLVKIYSHLAYVIAQQGRDQEAVEMATNAREAGKHGAFLNSFLVNKIDVRKFIDTEPHVVIHRARQKSQSDDHLSLRELEVIRLLSSGITNQEIADTLFISRNTVKIHLQNIYRKLGAANRREAVEVSRWMGLLKD